MPTDENADKEIPDCESRPEDSLNASVGAANHADEACPFPLDGPVPSYIRRCVPDIARIAAACDEIPREREFCSAQHHTAVTGARPRTSGSDCRCMAALMKVNGLEAYALLDTGSTTVSVTHDFARVARLDVIQLENPVQLQLGTVGSRSMINFGTKTRLELGPVREDNAYLDVVNIDRYDMIIGTPFMRKHGLVLDFEKNALTVQGELVHTLTSGQEDLMLARKQATRPRAPAPDKGRVGHATD